MIRRFSIYLGIITFVLLPTVAFASGTPESKSQQPVSVAMPRIAVAQGYPGLVPEFEKATGIKVNLLMLPEAGYEQKIMLELGSHGSSYDVVWAAVGAVERYASEGWLEPLGQYIDNKSLTDPQQFNFSDFLHGAVQMFQYKGEQYALPAMNATILMYYRKDIFQKFGIATPPKTWSDLMQVAEKINTKDVAAIAMRGSRVKFGANWPFPMIAHGFGARFVEDYPTDMHPVVNGPKMIEAANYYTTLLSKYGFDGATTAQFAQVIAAFQQGKAAIMIDGAPLVGLIEDPNKSTVAGKIGVAPVPRGPAAFWPAANGHGLSIPVGSKNKKVAWEFIMWALSKQTQLQNGLRNNETALTRLSVLNDPAYKEKFNYDNGGYLSALQYTFAHLQPYYYPIVPQWDQADQIFSIALSEILTGQAPAKAALDKANNQIYQVFKKAGYYSN